MVMKDGWLKTTIGILLILTVVILWVGSSFFVKYVVFGDVLKISNGNVSSDGYDIPYYLTYLCNGLFIVYLPIMGFKNLIVRVTSRGCSDNTDDDPMAQSQLLPDSDAPAAKELQPPVREDPDKAPTGRNILRKTIKWALIVCPFWFAANGTYNVSQSMTSVTSNSIISSTSGKGLVLLASRITFE